MTIDQLARHIIEQLVGKRRFIVAIAGPPGAGKSTAAENLAKDILSQGVRSRVITMDGFHLDNSVLQERNLLDRKGAPSTFDAAGFIHLVKRLASDENHIFIPKFDRAMDVAIAGKEEVTIRDQVIIVEGNYLLLKDQPWASLQTQWHATIFINPGIDRLEQRLVSRWINYGLNPQEARKRAAINDLKNAQTVLENSCDADFCFAKLNK